jgi:hypothetical protein
LNINDLDFIFNNLFHYQNYYKEFLQNLNNPYHILPIEKIYDNELNMMFLIRKDYHESKDTITFIIAGYTNSITNIGRILAFSHGKNTSSRRVPEGDGVTPGCFWGFPKEFLLFIHELGGVKVESS